jgi:hypothetical protein
MKVAGKTIDVALHEATVLQVEKYSVKGMFSINSPMRTFVRHTHVLFRLNDTNKTFSLDADDVELPVYKRQKVGIISLNRSVIGFADTDSDKYYYITNDFYNALNLGIPYLLVMLTGIAGAIFILSVLKTNYVSAWTLVPFVLGWIIYRAKKIIVNKEIETAVDKFMQDK